MDYVEQTTKVFLESLKVGQVVYEPFGPATFPDFLVDERIGVECTRLVSQVDFGNATYNVTEQAPRLFQAFETTIENIRSDTLTGSHWVSAEYEIWIDRKTAKSAIRGYLLQLAKLKSVVPHTKTLMENLQIDVFPSNKILKSPFALASVSYTNRNRCKTEVLASQIAAAMVRKAERVSASSLTVDEWWLAVAGGLTRELTNQEFAEIERQIERRLPWVKVLLLDFLAPTCPRILNTER